MHALPAYRLAAGVPAGVVLVALEALGARDRDLVRHRRHARRQDELLRSQRHRLPLAHHLDDPLARVVVVPRARALGGAPVVELHDLRVHLEPVADLVLRREHRPVVREGQVRQVVVPDRVVQAERLVALAPGVAGPLVALHDDRRHAEPPQARAEHDAALAAADDDAVRLALVAQLRRLGLPPLEPRLPLADRAVLDPFDALRPGPLLVALELDHRRQQRPAAPLAQPDVAAAPRHGGLERDPRFGDAGAGLGRIALDGPARRPHAVQRGLEHRGDLFAPLERADVPGERDQVPPEAVGLEVLDRGGDVPALEGGAEALEPGRHGCRRGRLAHGRSSLVGVYGLRSRAADRRPSRRAAWVSRAVWHGPEPIAKLAAPAANEPIGERA